MSDSLSNKELVAVGHQFAKAMSSDTAIIDMAKIVSRLAERLDCTTAALREMTKQRDALASLQQPAVDQKAVESLATDMMKRIDKITGERHSVATLSSLRMGIVEACRAAMLQGNHRDLSYPVDPQVAEYEKIMQQALPANSFTDQELEGMAHGDNPQANAYRELLAFRRGTPALTAGWVSVPVEPTAEMQSAAAGAIRFDTTPINKLWTGNAVYKAMLATAPHFREIGNSSTNNFRENAEMSTKCWCHTCRPVTISDMRFVVCPDCGNKRCPHANDHRNTCTGSNELGQEGSAYPAAPQQEVKP